MASSSFKILILNSGSSSIKYQLFDHDLHLLATGLLESIGERISHTKHEIIVKKASGHETEKVKILDEVKRIADHREGLQKIVDILTSPARGPHGEDYHALVESHTEIEAVGHRVVHGGSHFHGPVVVNDAVLQEIRDLSSIAPLHNPPNALGIEVAQLVFPGAVHVAVFDTSFHHTLPPEAYAYAIPRDLAETYSIRKYGFHGTSHEYISREAAKFLKKDLADLRLITLHLGNGCSVCAIKGGKSIDTSMGFTPLQGLIMGTRSGDIDPAVVGFLCEKTGKTVKQVETLLNKESGLKGISGFIDMRELSHHMNQGDEYAKLAFHAFCYRIRAYIGSYFVALGGCDAIVFSAGIGENHSLTRELVCQGLECIGVYIDYDENNRWLKHSHSVHDTDCSKVDVLVIPTNEELAIAAKAKAILEHSKSLACLPTDDDDCDTSSSSSVAPTVDWITSGSPLPSATAITPSTSSTPSASSTPDFDTENLQTARRMYLKFRKLRDAEIAEDPSCADEHDSLLKSFKALTATAKNTPAEFMCPITGNILVDPVTLDDSINYEREAAEVWLKNHTTSPATGKEMRSKTVTPNGLLREEVHDYCATLRQSMA